MSDFSEHTLTDLAVNLEAVQTRISRVKADTERLPDWEAKEAELVAEILKRIGVTAPEPTLDEVEGILACDPVEFGSDEPEPIEPMTDLSGVDYAPAFEGYQPNGHLPETD